MGSFLNKKHIVLSFQAKPKEKNNILNFAAWAIRSQRHASYRGKPAPSGKGAERDRCLRTAKKVTEFYVYDTMAWILLFKAAQQHSVSAVNGHEV